MKLRGAPWGTGKAFKEAKGSRGVAQSRTKFIPQPLNVEDSVQIQNLGEDLTSHWSICSSLAINRSWLAIALWSAGDQKRPA